MLHPLLHKVSHLSAYPLRQVRRRSRWCPDTARADRYRGRDFETFDSLVRGYLAVHDVWKLDGVFRPQTYYMGTKTLGRPVCLARSNASEQADYRYDIDRFELQRV